MAAEMVPPIRQDGGHGQRAERYLYTVTWKDGTTSDVPAETCAREGDDWVFRIGARVVERLPRAKVAHFTSA